MSRVYFSDYIRKYALLCINHKGDIFLYVLSLFPSPRCVISCAVRSQYITFHLFAEHSSVFVILHHVIADR